MVEFLRWVIPVTIGLIGLSVILIYIDWLLHLRRAPRCPHCDDWLEVTSDGGEVLYNCPGCGADVWERDVEKFGDQRK